MVNSRRAGIEIDKFRIQMMRDELNVSATRLFPNQDPHVPTATESTMVGSTSIPHDADADEDGSHVNVEEHFMIEADAFVAEFGVICEELHEKRFVCSMEGIYQRVSHFE